MITRHALLGFLVLGLASGAALAQTKKDLVSRVLQLQQPGIEAMATSIAQQPVAQIVQQVGPVLQRMPNDRREALSRDLDADIKKYIDEAVPIVRERAVRLAPSTIGVLLEDRFSEDELKELIALLESPVNRKWQGMASDMQRSITERLVNDVKPTVDPKARALAESVNRRMNAAMQQAPAASGPGPRR
jgi:uncharacterized protein